MGKGRLLVLQPVSLARYMATCEAVQEAVSQNYPPTVLIYPGWERKSLSIGRLQRTDSINLDACREDRLDVVRRPTGGYAVIHQHDDVTYVVVVPRKLAGDKKGFDNKISPILVKSLEQMNVPDCHGPFPEPYGAIYVNDKKIAGSTQSHGRRAWIQHGIIAVRRHSADDYIRYVNGEKHAELIQSKMTSIEEESGIADSARLAVVMAEEFQRNFWGIGIDLEEEQSLSSGEIEGAEDLFNRRYANVSWLENGIRRYDKSGRVACFTESPS